jgi:hypothetical protein
VGCRNHVDAWIRTGQREYARRFVSTPGTHDGLYWPSEDQSDISPLNGFVEDANLAERSGEKPEPYDGYYFRILTAQGPAACRAYVAAQDEYFRLDRDGNGLRRIKRKKLVKERSDPVQFQGLFRQLFDTEPWAARRERGRGPSRRTSGLVSSTRTPGPSLARAWGRGLAVDRPEYQAKEPSFR